MKGRKTGMKKQLSHLSSHEVSLLWKLFVNLTSKMFIDRVQVLLVNQKCKMITFSFNMKEQRVVVFYSKSDSFSLKH